MAETLADDWAPRISNKAGTVRLLSDKITKQSVGR